METNQKNTVRDTTVGIIILLALAGGVLWLYRDQVPPVVVDTPSPTTDTYQSTTTQNTNGQPSQPTITNTTILPASDLAPEEGDF